MRLDDFDPNEIDIEDQRGQALTRRRFNVLYIECAA